MNETVKLELDQSVVARLIQSKQLTLDDFRCLDYSTKTAVWQLFLKGASKPTPPTVQR